MRLTLRWTLIGMQKCRQLTISVLAYLLFLFCKYSSFLSLVDKMNIETIKRRYHNEIFEQSLKTCNTDKQNLKVNM